MVSDRSGVARSTLYRHWRTKEELLRDAFAAQAGGNAAPGDHGAVPAGPGDARGALVAYAQAVAAGLAEVWGVAAVSLAGSATTDPEQRAVQRVLVEDTRRDLHAVVTAGRASGDLDLSADPEALIERLLDLVIAPMSYRYQFTDHPVTRPQAAQLASAAWDALHAG